MQPARFLRRALPAETVAASNSTVYGVELPTGLSGLNSYLVSIAYTALNQPAECGNFDREPLPGLPQWCELLEERAGCPRRCRERGGSHSRRYGAARG